MIPLRDYKGHQVEQLLLEAQMGQIVDCEVVWRFGRSETITTSECVIWEGNCSYTYLTSASTLTLESSNIDDTMDIYIEGLDSNYNKISEVITLSGTTQVTTTNSYIRVYRAFNNNSIDLIGDVSIKQGASTLLYISASAQQSLAAIYTIPAGYTGYLFQGNASTSKLKDVQIFYKTRPFGKTFITQETFGLYQNSLEAARPFLPVPEKTDLQVSAISSSSNTDTSVQFGILLFKNSTWSN